MFPLAQRVANSSYELLVRSKKLTRSVELAKIPEVKQSKDSRWICDHCVREIQPGERVTVYGSNKNWALPPGQQVYPRIVLQRHYCKYCDWREVPLPHHGTEECVTIGKMVETKEGFIFDQRGVISASGVESGYEWEPVALLSEFLGFPANQSYHPKTGLNPAATYGEFLFHGIRLDGFVTEDDEFQLPEDELIEQAKGIFEDSMERHGQRMSGFH